MIHLYLKLDLSLLKICSIVQYEKKILCFFGKMYENLKRAYDAREKQTISGQLIFACEQEMKIAPVHLQFFIHSKKSINLVRNV